MVLELVTVSGDQGAASVGPVASKTSQRLAVRVSERRPRERRIHARPYSHATPEVQQDADAAASFVLVRSVQLGTLRVGVVHRDGAVRSNQNHAGHHEHDHHHPDAADEDRHSGSAALVGQHPKDPGGEDRRHPEANEYTRLPEAEKPQRHREQERDDGGDQEEPEPQASPRRGDAAHSSIFSALPICMKVGAHRPTKMPQR